MIKCGSDQAYGLTAKARLLLYITDRSKPILKNKLVVDFILHRLWPEFDNSTIPQDCDRRSLFNKN
ncbi:Ribonuclease T2-like [Parasponia andersonii]|uniref:Ribonuclease T2-like n=1 Tax=Parasponia andersonii TaxID=3476 RepID=A0A2P5CWQ9_PARAD|nr:Ribonuclease T2-like [Parasponia andersonii]